MLDELEILIREATQQTEEMISLEDRGWINFSKQLSGIISTQERIAIVQKARLYAMKDPLCFRAVHMMTDYCFGTGISWNAEDENTNKILSAFWNDKGNAPLLSARGQRKTSDKLLVDGEVFFAIFLGPQGKTLFRRVNPLEITEIITNPDDLEDARYYKREWMTPQMTSKVGYYRSLSNEKDKATPDSLGVSVQMNQDALIYQLAVNDLDQRGNSYLLPALDWVKLYRQFLASRVAVALAVARFAWKIKVLGGQTAVNAAKGLYNEAQVPAGSTAIENMGADLQPIRVDSGASQAYQDGRMIKLQVSAATGWPEQYFGDISIGNLATAKTVELPVQKMCESYQATCKGAYQDIFNFILEHEGIAEDKRYVDIDFPAITPESILETAQAMGTLLPLFPEVAATRDVQQQALLSMGIKDVNKVLDQIASEAKHDPNIALAKALRLFREVLKGEAVK